MSETGWQGRDEPMRKVTRWVHITSAALGDLRRRRRPMCLQLRHTVSAIVTIPSYLPPRSKIGMADPLCAPRIVGRRSMRGITERTPPSDLRAFVLSPPRPISSSCRSELIPFLSLPGSPLCSLVSSSPQPPLTAASWIMGMH